MVALIRLLDRFEQLPFAAVDDVCLVKEVQAVGSRGRRGTRSTLSS